MEPEREPMVERSGAEEPEQRASGLDVEEGVPCPPVPQPEPEPQGHPFNKTYRPNPRPQSEPELQVDEEEAERDEGDDAQQDPAPEVRAQRRVLGMEPPDGRAEAAAAPTAEEAVSDVGQDPEKAPLVDLAEELAAELADLAEELVDLAEEPEPAELGAVRVDVTEQAQQEQREDGIISITLKEFVTGYTFQVSISADADIAALKRLIHEEHDGAAEPDGQRLVLNRSPLEDETERLPDLGIVDGTELRLGVQDAAEGRARREERRAKRAKAEEDRLLAEQEAQRARLRWQERKAAIKQCCAGACALAFTGGGVVQTVGLMSLYGDLARSCGIIGGALVLSGAMGFFGLIQKPRGYLQAFPTGCGLFLPLFFYAVFSVMATGTNCCPETSVTIGNVTSDNTMAWGDRFGHKCGGRGDGACGGAFLLEVVAVLCFSCSAGIVYFELCRFGEPED